MDLSLMDPKGGGHDLILQAIGELQPAERILNIGTKTGSQRLLVARLVGHS